MEIAVAQARVAVSESSQPSAARFAAREAADRAGFSEEDSYRAGLIATELATNLVKHTTGGEILVRRIATGDAAEVEILAVDRGPGMSDVSRSLSDGHSTAGTAGTGLGAVIRMSDESDIYSQEGRGTIVYSRVRAGRRAPRRATRFQVGAVSIAKEGEAVCGDAWQTAEHRGGLLLAIVDGLGHGVQAREAATAAIASIAIDGYSDTDLPAVLQSMHECIRHTRGAAGAVAEIRGRVLRFAGVGNIAGVVTAPGVVRHTVSMSGTLGFEARHFREYSYPWDRNSLFVMFSDGLASHWSLDEYRGIRQHAPAVVAAALYRDFTRQRDDVTVVVGKELS